MSGISGLRNDMNKRTFYKERKINNRCFDFLSKQNIIVRTNPGQVYGLLNLIYNHKCATTLSKGVII